MSDLPLNRVPLNPITENLPLSGDLIRNTDLLLGGALYTSPWIDVAAFPELRLRSISNVASAVGGVVIQWSLDDGLTVAAATIPASALAGIIYDSGIIARNYNYARVLYLNGAGAQTAFRLALEGYSVPGGGGGGAIAVNVDLQGQIESQPSPDPSSQRSALGDLALLSDPDHALRTRTRALTDEGSFYDDFPGAALATPIVGNVTLTNLSTAWSRVLATTPLRVGDYLYITAHTSAVAAQIDTIAAGGLSGTLRTAYAGATATAAASMQNWLDTVVDGPPAVGHTITVAGSSVLLTMAAAGVNGDLLQLARQLGAGARKAFLPLRLAFALTIDNRRANQTAFVGVFNTASILTATAGAYVLLSGADTQYQARLTTFSATGVQQQRTVTLLDGEHTDNAAGFEMDVRPDQVAFYEHHDRLGEPLWVHLPDPYAPLYLIIAIRDSGAVAAATIFSVDQIESLTENLIQIQCEQPNPDRLQASTKDITPNGPTVGTSVTVDSDLVHTIAATVAGMRYRVSVVGGAGLCLRVDGTNAVVTDEPWYDGQKFNFIATATSATGVTAIKRTAGTADGTVIVTPLV